MNEEKLLKCFDNELKKYVDKFNALNNQNKLEGDESFDYSIEKGEPIDPIDDANIYEIKYIITYKNVIDFYVFLEFTKAENVLVEFESIGRHDWRFFKRIQEFSKYIETIPFGNFMECFKLLKKEGEK